MITNFLNVAESRYVATVIDRKFLPQDMFAKADSL